MPPEVRASASSRQPALQQIDRGSVPRSAEDLHGSRTLPARSARSSAGRGTAAMSRRGRVIAYRRRLSRQWPTSSRRSAAEIDPQPERPTTARTRLGDARSMPAAPRSGRAAGEGADTPIVGSSGGLPIEWRSRQGVSPPPSDRGSGWTFWCSVPQPGTPGVANVSVSCCGAKSPQTAAPAPPHAGAAVFDSLGGTASRKGHGAQMKADWRSPRPRWPRSPPGLACGGSEIRRRRW
jgi:hypothetical protein